MKDLLFGERFMDQSPCEVYATLLDEGPYHCSVRTMYRILGEDQTSPNPAQFTKTLAGKV